MTNDYKYINLSGKKCRKGNLLKEVLTPWKDGKECIAVISPHDDDGVLGAGLLMQLAQEESVEVHIIIVTDGSMGYCTREEQKLISNIRRNETYKCYKALGIPESNIHWLGFPDCNLFHYQGRRKCTDHENNQLAGYTGLQNSFTHSLRDVCPTHCFIPTRNDLHPDHKIIYDELLISIFHATGSIWPELGPAMDKTPSVHEIAIYCDFPTPPNLRLCAEEHYLEKKLYAINAFQSQKQISTLIEGVRSAGPYEYIRTLNFNFYQPQKYFELFEQHLKKTLVNHT